MIAPAWCASRALRQAAAALAVAVSAASAFAQTNLLQNGGFESSFFNDSLSSSQGIGYVGALPNGNSGFATVPSWTITPGAFSPSTFALNRSGGALSVPAEEGTYSVSFGTGSAQNGGSISQSFAVTSGAHCTVSFWVRRIGGGQGIGARVEVLNGASEVTLTDSGNTNYSAGYTVPIPSTANTWSQVVLKFNAPSSTLTFKFTDTTPQNGADSTDLGLDNISITQKTLQNFTILGGSGNPGEVAANTEWSNDGDATWHPAYLYGSHPWGVIHGTNSWINQIASGTNAGLYQTTDYRIRFNLPADFETTSATFQIDADDYAVMSLNGNAMPVQSGVGVADQAPVRTIDSSFFALGQVNTINIALSDLYGGWVGINYRIDISGYSSSTPTVVVLPPVITSGSAASGTVGVAFSFQLAGGNNPTSFGAANLPPGLSINGATGLISGTPTTVGTYSSTISETNSGGTTTGTLTITINKGAATVTLGSLSQVYDGTVKSATATTTPGNLSVSFSYTGNALPPINAGIYGVFGAVSDANYTGSASGNLTISAAPLTITLGNLSQTYTGSGLRATVTTSPANIATTTTYNGGASLPVNVGNYTVAASSANSNYTGTKSGTLTITPASLGITFGNLSQVYNGGTHPVTVSTTPSGVATTTVTYAGSTTPPTNAGNYTVAAASANGNYTGNATATLTVAPQPTTITFGNTVQSYDGTPKTVATTTAPATNVPLFITYNGSITFPKAVGNYSVSATTNNPNYTGNATTTLQIKDTTPPVISTSGNLTLEATLAGGAIANFTGSATDDVDGTDAVTFSPASGSLFALGTTTVTASSHDAAGNPATQTFSVAVRDTTAPTILGTPLVSESFAGYSGNQNALQYQSNLKVAYAGSIPGWLGAGFHAVHAVDRTGSGNWAIMIFNDNVITQAKGVAANDAGKTYAVAFTVSPATYTTASQSTAAADGVIVSVLRGDGTTLASYTAQPGAWNGNVSFSGYTFNYTGDGSGPVRLQVSSLLTSDNRMGGAIDDLAIGDATEANQTLEATSAAGASTTFTATAIDRVSGYTAVTASPTSGSTFPIGTSTVTLRSNDGAGNTGTSTFNVAVKDTTGPMITAPADKVVEATDAAGSVVTFAGSATDLVDGSVAVTATPASGSKFPIGTTMVTLSATDAHANTSTKTFNVTVRDTAAPALVVPHNQVLEATSGSGAIATFAASATDAVTSAPTLAYSAASGSTFPIGTTTVTVTATDATGNVNSGSFTITVRDTTAPSIATPANVTAEATSAAGAVVTFSTSAHDIVDGTVTVVASPASGSTFALGTTTVTLTATDAHANTSTSSFTVTVKDTTAPTLNLPANLTLEATGPSGAVATYFASATDAVTASPVIGYSVASGTTFSIGTTTVNVTATDEAGNVSSGSFTVTVQDTTAPAISAPANIVTEATSPAGAVAAFSASANDIVDGAVAVTSDIASGTTFPLGTTAVTLTSTDAHGNTSHAVFSVTVHDTTAPVIASQDNLIVEATSADGALVTFTPSANDIVSGAVAVVASPASGSVFPIGTTKVTLAASDAVGNFATSDFTVTVRDTTPPVISGPGNLSAEATSAAGAVVTFSASAMDIVDGAVAVTASPASGSTFALGTTTVTLTATDAHGNTSSSSFTVAVKDTTAPKLTVPANVTLEATSAAGAVATFAASATDAVTASPLLGYSKASGSTFALGTTTVNVTATDAAGNVSKGSFTVTVVDTTAPALTIPANQVLEATSPAGASASFTASATDAVTSSPTIAYSVSSGSTFALGTTTVNVSATDAAGNVSKGSFTITVRDTTAPKLTVPANLTLEATSAAGAVANFVASATDVVTASPAIAYNIAPGSTFAIGTTTVNVSATDAAGNKSTGSFTVTVHDTTAPTISSVTASPGSIWPPDKKMVPVTVSVNTTDIVGVSSVKIVSVSTNEPDGTTQWEITGNLTLNLKADRLGTGNGRVYTITVEVRDAAGNATRKTVTVDVPHDQR